jgi:radical SAM superfamily enzyme YgiQ (UPF0313 family)
VKIALVVPPISDLNTPYAAMPRLAGWLRKLGHEVVPVDLSLELFLRVFSRAGLERVFAAIDPATLSTENLSIYIHRHRYIAIIDEVVAFAQGRDLGLIQRIVRRDMIPEGPHFHAESSSTLRGAFGDFGNGDLARHLIAWMFGDLILLIRTITPHMGMTSYAEKLGDTLPSFDNMDAELKRPPNEIERMMLEAAEDTLPADLDLVCLTCPFPGNLFGALAIGRWLGEHRPKARRALGGGYPTTELRDLQDPRVFDYVDTMSLDDGEVPLQQICARLEGRDVPLVRTFTREHGRVVLHDGAGDTPRFGDLPPPDYQGIDLTRYVHLLYRRNHVSRLQSEGTWLKLTAAHGCYWKKCTFCDIHLSYIGDYDPMSARELADQMDAMNRQTGLSSFHFTDEAAPPALLVGLSLELLRRGRTYQFWGNVRFDSYFTPDRCRLLAAAGMIAVSGGIEIASDDLLPKISKGITVPQVVRVLHALSSAGILTHAYLIYGFPGETPQDTVNSLEVIRQLMRAKALHSAFYHFFTLTKHAPITKQPALYGIQLKSSMFKGFSNYVIPYQTNVSPPIPAVFNRVQIAVQVFSRGEGLDTDVMSWFEPGMVPKPSVSRTLVADVLAAEPPAVRADARLCWLGGMPSWSGGTITVGCERGDLYSAEAPEWLAANLTRCHPRGWEDATPPKASAFPEGAWYQEMRARGIILV